MAKEQKKNYLDELIAAEVPREVQPPELECPRLDTRIRAYLEQRVSFEEQ